MPNLDYFNVLNSKKQTKKKTTGAELPPLPELLCCPASVILLTITHVYTDYITIISTYMSQTVA